MVAIATVSLLLLSKHPKPLLLPRRSFRFFLRRESVLLLSPSAQTGESNDDHGKEEQRERNAKTPSSGPEVGMTARFVMIDMVAQDPKCAEVGGHDDQTQDPGDEGDEDCRKRPQYAGANGHDPGDESYATGNGV
jgi:hypothetical protein